MLGIIGFLDLAFFKPAPQADESLDPLWHRLEVGDLTRGEFERLRNKTLFQRRLQERHW